MRGCPDDVNLIGEFLGDQKKSFLSVGTSMVDYLVLLLILFYWIACVILLISIRSIFGACVFAFCRPLEKVVLLDIDSPSFN